MFRGMRAVRIGPESVSVLGRITHNSVIRSFCRPAQCWDNAVGERWFSTLKTDRVHRYAWPTRARARLAISEFIEVFYNRQRLHSSLGMLSPVEYEESLTIPQYAASHAA